MEWNLLMETKKKLVDDNAHFGLKEPEFTFVEEVEGDLDKHEEMWGLFEEFNRELREMSKEEWIIFRYLLLNLTSARPFSNEYYFL